MSNEKVPVPAGQNALAVPAFIERGRDGMENVTKEDLLLPRLRLSQALSPWVGEGKAKVGEMVNSLDVTINFGKEASLIPLVFFRSRIRWTPRNENAPSDAPKGIECLSMDGLKAREAKGIQKDGTATDVCSACVLTKFENGVAPRCTLYKNFIALLNRQLVAVSFERTKVKAADTLLSLATMLGGGGLPLYAGRYTLRTREDRNSKGQPYWNYVIEGGGFCSEEEFRTAKDAYTGVKDKALVIDQGDDGHEGSPSGDGTAAPF
jgi:hypothetical protein